MFAMAAKAATVLLLSVTVAFLAAAQAQLDDLEVPAILVVHPRPPFQSTGSRLSLSCAAFGNPLPNITWSVRTPDNDDFTELVATDPSVNIYTHNVTIDNDVFVLSILELCSTASTKLPLAEYECIASNGVLGDQGEARATFDIAPIAPEPALLLAHADSRFNVDGRRLSISCVAFGSPTPYISWFSSNLGSIEATTNDTSMNIYTKEFLDRSGDILVLSVLEVCDSPLSAVSEYTCLASNEITGEVIGVNNFTFAPAPVVTIEEIDYVQRPTTAAFTIMFSGPVDIATIGCDLRELTLLNTSTADLHNVQFQPEYQGSCDQHSEDGILAVLDIQDYITLISDDTLRGLVSLDTYINWTSNFIGYPYILNISAEALMVTRFFPVSPSISYVDLYLDYNNPILRVDFGSFIETSTLNFTKVTLQNGPGSNSTANYTLTDGTIANHPRIATTVCIEIEPSDTLAIAPFLDCLYHSCYVQFEESFALDFNSISTGEANLRMTSVRLPISSNSVANMTLYIERPGCTFETTLAPDEVYIIREREKITRVECSTEPPLMPELRWENGGLSLNSYEPNFQYDSPFLAFASFPDGMPQQNYGLYVCMFNESNFIRNYIHDINPFIGLPGGDTLPFQFYYPIYYSFVIGTLPQSFFDELDIFIDPVDNTTTQVPNITFISPSSVFVSYDNAVYSLNGTYNISVNIPELDVRLSTLVTLDVQAPNVTVFPKLLPLIQGNEVVVNLSCIVSHPGLSVFVTEGEREIQNGGPFMLSRDGGVYILTLSYGADETISGEPFTCHVRNPEMPAESIGDDTTSVRFVSGNLTVWQDGTQIFPGDSVINNRAGGELELLCLGTPGNEGVLWRIVEVEGPPGVDLSSNFNFYSSGAYDTTMTVNEIGGLTGTFRCESDVSGLAVNIFLSSELEFCSPEVDPVWNIRWSKTPVGINDQQTCPRINGQETEGMATRLCREDGTWVDLVNVSTCRSRETVQAEQLAEDAVLNEDATPSDSDISDVTDALLNVLEVEDETALIPGDVATVISITERVVAVLRNSSRIANITEPHTELADVFSNLLNENTSVVWRQLDMMDLPGSQQLLQNAESYGAYLAETLADATVDTGVSANITISRENIEIDARIPKDEAEFVDVVFPVDTNPLSKRGQIRLPATRLSALNAKATVTILFQNLEDFLPDTFTNNKTKPIASVLSSQILTDSPSTSDTTELEPVELTFSTDKLEGGTYTNFMCVFWNFSTPIGRGGWISENVETVRTEERVDGVFEVSCNSAHLTSFAVVADVGVEDQEEEFEFTTPVYVGCGILLLFAFIATIIAVIAMLVCCCRNGKLAGLHYFVHMNIGLALMSSYIAFLGGLTMALDNEHVCTAVAGILQYFFTAAFSWFLCEAIMVSCILIVTNFGFIWWLILFVLGWGLPVIPTVVTVVALRDEYETDGYCWFAVERDETSRILWAFVAPKLAIILLIILFLIIIIGCNCRFVSMELRDASKKGAFCRAWLLLVALVITVPLLVGAWAFGLLLVEDMLPDVSEWAFTAFSIAVGVVFAVFTVALVAVDHKKRSQPKAEDREGHIGRMRTPSMSGAKYWSDKKPILPESAGSNYELKEIAGEGNEHPAHATAETSPDDQLAATKPEKKEGQKDGF